jgi:WD40 repeat protein
MKRYYGLLVVGLLVSAAALSPLRSAGDGAAPSQDPDGYALPGHKLAVLSVAWSPDGAQLVTQDLEVFRIWEVASRKALRSWKRANGEKDAVWSPDGKRLATADFDGWLRVRDAASTRVLFTLRFGKGVLSRPAWSRDGQRIAVVNSEGGAILDAHTGKRLLRLTAGGDFLGCVAWSPDGRRLATGGSRNVLRIWSASDGKQQQKLVVEPHLQSHTIGLNEPRWSDTINAVAWHPSGDTVAAAYEDGSVRVWNPAETDAQEIDAHEVVKLSDPYFGSSYWGVRDLAWRPDGSQLATAGGDGALTVWNTGSGKPAWTYHSFERVEYRKGRFEGGARTVDWSPDGKWLAVGGWSTELQVRKTQPAPGTP